MFVQVIQGQVSDPGPVRAALDQWLQELGPGAEGWLGSTTGVTDDGRLIALVRFDSEEAARRNSDRPEQSQWWGEMSTLFIGEPTFHNSTRVDVDIQGDPDDAGFVQIIQGRSSDPARSRELMEQMDTYEWAAFRPEIIGSVGVEHDGDAYTMALFFTSEQAAREGERKEPPAKLKAQMQELDTLGVGEPAFFDLRQPWLDSPR